MPCNEQAYREARGRYGLEKAYLRTNGPFVLEEWDNTKWIRLQKNEAYRSENPVLAGGVTFYIGRENPSALFLDGKSDAAFLSFADVASPRAKDVQVQEIDRTVWCIVFNQNHPLWGNALLRQGLAQALDRDALAEGLPGHFTAAELFIPPAMRVLGTPFRQEGARSPLAFDAQKGAHLFTLGLQAQGIAKLPSTASLPVPDTGDALLVMGLAQQSWQEYLSAYVSLERRSAQQIEEALRGGDFGMLLMPFSPENPHVEALLEVFASDSPHNFYGYRNARYDALLEAARRAPDLQGALENYRQAEGMLLLDAVIIPVYFETAYYATAPQVRGLALNALTGGIAFQSAVKEKFIP
jgi:oligopeptide transport system substrate-binding protein